MGQEKVKFFSGQEKVRKKQHWSGKFEKIRKSQEKHKIFFENSMVSAVLSTFIYQKKISLAALRIISISNFVAIFAC